MLISVLALGGAMLTATTIAGILTLYQLRASTNSVNSSKAIFAADTGIEWGLFDYFCSVHGQTCPTGSGPTLANGSKVTVTCYDATFATTTCGNTTTVAYALARGAMLSTDRAFYLEMNSATGSTP